MFRFLKSKPKKMYLKACHDFTADINDFHLITTSLGPNREILALAVNGVRERIDGMFPPAKTSTNHHYRAVIKSIDDVRKVDVSNQPWNYQFVQLIEKNKLLIACARSYFYGDGNYDHNGKIFDFDGTLVREFLLGDGIEDVQVTNDDTIWTSYFDEGIFGNYGWNEPVGASGLRAWDKDGKERFVYPASENHYIDDCYALNCVSDEEIWFYSLRM
jgi:hypothetical protein